MSVVQVHEALIVAAGVVARAEHQAGPDWRCTRCGRLFPCATLRAVRDAW